MKINQIAFKLSILFLLIAQLGFNNAGAKAQDDGEWSYPKQIPGYENDTWTPILIADRNREIHAFASQWLREKGVPSSKLITYNRWDLRNGWTLPTDILISPYKNEARLLDAILDANGVVHLIFFGGDSTSANIYYSNAQIKDAQNARAWKTPILVAEDAQDPENGQIFVDDNNNLTILFAGRSIGNGIYTTSSQNQGINWSKPNLLFNVIDRNYMVHALKDFNDSSENVHIIWNEVTSGGQGRGILYSQKPKNSLEWTKPVILAAADSGYGTNTPNIIEYSNKIFAFFNLGSIIWQRVSEDGKVWSSPTQLFSRHIGVNGAIALVVDGDDKLQIFFGQRITGSPDIHGMWNSVWSGSQWAEPESLISGPRISDYTTNKAFDPNNAKAVISQGNVLFVAWMEDPGLNGNGIWYSYKVLDTSELATYEPETKSTQQKTPTQIYLSPLVPTLMPAPNQGIDSSHSNSVQITNSNALIMSFLSVVSFIVIFLFIQLKKRNR
jgi:hypothetical protein